MSEKISAFVATPTHTKSLDLGFVDSMWTIKERQLIDPAFRDKYNIEFHFISGSLINRCRNELIGFFLDSEYDYMLFIDSDITDYVDVFYDVIDKYVELEKENENLIVGSVYPIKQFFFDRMKEMIDNGADIKDAHEFILNYNVNFPPTDTQKVLQTCKDNNGWVELSQIGGGFQMFSKKMIHNMIKQYPETAYQPFDNQTGLPRKLYDLCQSFVKDGVYLSEDYGFCELLRDMGGKVYGNLYHKLGHRGSHIYMGTPINHVLYTQTTGNSKR